MSNKLMTATEFARVCQVTPRTIRWYQSQGLLKPIKIDTWNKYAYFAPEQALQIFRIKMLQQFNLPLSQIKILINGNKLISLDDELKKFDLFIKEKQKEFMLLKQINNILLPNPEPNLKNQLIGPYQLFCLKIENGDYHKLDEYLNQLRKLANNLKVQVLDSEITVYLDPELKYKPKQSDLEIALIVKKMPKKALLLLPKNFYFRKFPKTKALTFTFTGPYNYLSLIYKKTDQYIKDQKIKLTGPVFEMYLKNPKNTKSSFNYITKICYPIS